MNSLEFINLEIAITNTKYKEHLKFAQFELAIKDEKRLQTLHQIKAEIEAWYVVKKHLEYFPSDYYNGIPEDVITMTSEIDKIDYPIIKKALEIRKEQ